MTEQTFSMAALLQQHRATYLQTLPARLAQLDALAPRLLDRAQRPAAVTAVERCAHTIAGSAGTFGFSALGREARALELLVNETGACAQDAQAAAILERLLALCGQLQATLAAQDTDQQRHSR